MNRAPVLTYTRALPFLGIERPGFGVRGSISAQGTMSSLDQILLLDPVLNNIGVFLDLASRDSWSTISTSWLNVLRERTWLFTEWAVSVIG